MKYLVLGGESYYPTGGGDSLFSSDKLTPAMDKAKSYLGTYTKDRDNWGIKIEWVDVVDTDTLEIVWSGHDD